MTSKKPVALLQQVFLYKENHAIVAWFRKALAMSPKTVKLLMCYYNIVTCQLRQITHQEDILCKMIVRTQKV